jgi:hypothetical protein
MLRLSIGPMLARALESQTRYERYSPLNDRRKKGFFTPPEVCGFMAGLLSLKPRAAFKLLDPGAGAGSLAAAFCGRVPDLGLSPKHLPYPGSEVYNDA